MGLIELDIPPGRVFFINSALPDKVFQLMLLAVVQFGKLHPAYPGAVALVYVSFLEIGYDFTIDVVDNNRIVGSYN